MSSDGVFLAARLAAAEARGERAELAVPAALVRRRDEFADAQARMRGSLGRFIDDVTDRLAGRRVLMLGTTNVLLEMARAGLKAGKESAFAPDSVLLTGGGAKNQVLPPTGRRPSPVSSA